jgi:hypothetical protein
MRYNGTHNTLHGKKHSLKTAPKVWSQNNKILFLNSRPPYIQCWMYSHYMTDGNHFYMYWQCFRDFGKILNIKFEMFDEQSAQKTKAHGPAIEWGGVWSVCCWWWSVPTSSVCAHSMRLMQGCIIKGLGKWW